MPPSNTGVSANEPPGPSNAEYLFSSTGRALEDPNTSRLKPQTDLRTVGLDGIQSRPREYLREATRSSRKSNSRSESLDNNGVLLTTLADVAGFPAQPILYKSDACPEIGRELWKNAIWSVWSAPRFGFQNFADLHGEQIQLERLLQQRCLTFPLVLPFWTYVSLGVTRHEDDLNLRA